VRDDFFAAEEYVGVFDSVRPIYDFDRQWDADAYANSPTHTVASIKAGMAKINRWEKELEKMRVGQTVGIMAVESRKLKQMLVPMTTSKMDTMKELVKSLARVKCKEQLGEFKQRIQVLTQRPTHLKEFAAFVERMDALKQQARMLSKTTAVVEEMYRLLASYAVKIGPNDAVQQDDLRNVQEEYKQETDAADAFVEERMGEMTQQLDGSIGRLNDQLSTLNELLSQGVFIDPNHFDEPETPLQQLEDMRKKLSNLEELSKTYSRHQELFSIPVYEYQGLAKTSAQFDVMHMLWSNVLAWNESYDSWMRDDFTELNVEEMNKAVSLFFKDSFAAHKKLDTEVTGKLKEKVTEFKQSMPLVLELGNPAMRPRHWEKLYKALEQPWYPELVFNLEDLIAHGIMEHKDLISETSAAASGEEQLQASLDSIRRGWADIEFPLLPYRDTKNVFTLGSLEEVSTLLEDNQVTLQTMMGSRFIMGVRDDVEKWEKKLGLLGDTLDEWMAVQRNWMYLETIFGAEDIQKQLPVESQKFQAVDKSWRQLMAATNKNPNVIACVNNGTATLTLMQSCNITLEEIQKSLEEYLETKRMAFPRFYFLSNDELLEILSQTRDPQAVQPHMGKCFDAIKKIRFSEEKREEIQGMMAPDGEYVPFSDVVVAEGPVEGWLTACQDAMKQCLYDQIKQSWQQYPADDVAVDRSEWLIAYCAQAVIAVDQIFWTRNLAAAIRRVEKGEDKDACKAFLTFSLEQIASMVAMVRGELTKGQRKMLGAVITIDVHARSVVMGIIEKEVDKESDFEWTRQLRYYWDVEERDGEGDCVCRQTNTRFLYGFEYLGNSDRLVITPLTDICYMTLTGALHLRLGGAPAGPAGTGKTETTKDLGKALAIQTIVFNCSDGLDYKIMGRFFSGLCQAGAWSCFDEFNRIDIEVLSVIAQQVLCIQVAIIEGLPEVDFEGTVIPVNTNFGVFITMNPGYAGRTELPDNLKSLFRPVAMMVPDYRLIAEIVLFSQGFENALPLSNKMTKLYSLSSEQLSKQDHYDFGMRAVKSVLVAAGQLKRKEPEAWEDLLLIRAMRDSNVPKFLEADLPLFRGIIADLFPGVDVPFVDYGELQAAIENQLDELNLQRVPAFIAKVIQVHETQLVRHGMMVVGEAGSGKTTNQLILARALTQLKNDGVTDRDGFFQKVDRLVLNPKSISAGQLYGEFNLQSGEWADGLVPKLVRECVAIAETGVEDRKWVTFDGPVDAVWIENMNTVLDDNKMLCLANSERIKLASTMHMMFEVMDLKVASPATVSRCGMVYMEQVHVGTLSLMETWALSVMPEILDERCGRNLLALIREHVPACLDFVRENCREKIPSSDGNLMQSLLNLLTSMAMAAGRDHRSIQTLVPFLLVFSLVWTVGANIDDASRAPFSQFVLERMGKLVDAGGTFDNVYEYCLDEEAVQWVPWTDIVPQFHYNPETPYFNLLVQTKDTTRYRFLLDKLLRKSSHVLFMGQTGVGKSVIVQEFLDAMGQTDEYTSYTMGYSAQTSPANLREVFETKLEKKRKTLLGPPAGKKMLFLVDDLNMPALEVYGAQPPNELLRQTLDQGGFYDTGKLFFKRVKDVIFAAACAPPGGGRNDISPRLTRHFNMVWLPSLDDQSMVRIFQMILKGFLQLELPELASLAEPMVHASVRVYRRVEEDLLPTPAKSHYTFNLRDLSKVFQGVLKASRAAVEDPEGLIKLWIHEESRVFRDRLINEDDRDWFNSCITDTMSEKGLVKEAWEVPSFKDLLFGEYMSRDKNRCYSEVESEAKLHMLLSEYLEEYNITYSPPMNLVFFDDAMAHVSRICRVMAQPRGSALLVGVGGSGRQSLTRLSSHMMDYQLFSIEITRGYGVNEFHDNLKEILMEAGAKGKHVTFLFSDTQIVKESFLEDINNLLTSGEVPNLFAEDEMAKIVSDVRPLAKAAGKPETRDAILQHFVQLVRENLHVVLALSPIGAAFRTRCRMFPALVNCCTINWFSAWPKQALKSVADRFLNEGAAELQITQYVESLGEMAVMIHSTVQSATERYFAELGRFNYTTPTSYLELIKLYMNMLREQREIVEKKEERYRGGLQKLAETEVVVTNLGEELVKLQPTLVASSKETEALLVTVAADQKAADLVQISVEKDVEAANKVAQEVGVIKAECEKDLAEAMPAFHASVKALDSLDKAALQELKQFNSPPEMVGVVMEAVCILFGVKTEWKQAKVLLGDMGLLSKLANYDKDNIDPKIIKKIGKYMKDERFEPEKLVSVSSACVSLCMWVRAMHTYDRVAKNIGPKKEKLAEAEANQAKVDAEVRAKQKQLEDTKAKVAQLQRTLQEAQQKKAKLERQQGKTKAQLSRAKQLTDSLGDEKERWLQSAEALAVDLTNLVGNMVLSAGCVAYLGAFTMEYRGYMAGLWVKTCNEKRIPVDPKFSLEKTLANPVLVREWNILGLPADEFSTENGMFATIGRRWPLMIDPQGQANRWVKNMYKDENLKVIKLTEKDFLRTLENAIRYGQPVLLENVEEVLDPSLEPILVKAIVKKSGQNMLRLGDTDVPYNDDFKFFITTKIANPHYMPEVCIKVTVINFTVTMSGLENQLLVDVIRNERPDLEAKKDELVVSIASDQKELKDIEDTILRLLAQSEGNILDDEELINTLGQSKVKSKAIKERMTEAEQTSIEINQTREGYRSVATRGSIIYFVIANLALVDPMYQVRAARAHATNAQNHNSHNCTTPQPCTTAPSRALRFDARPPAPPPLTRLSFSPPPFATRSTLCSTTRRCSCTGCCTASRWMPSSTTPSRSGWPSCCWTSRATCTSTSAAASSRRTSCC
jgi:dynein heavy chain